jgi:hypothetical protein
MAPPRLWKGAPNGAERPIPAGPIPGRQNRASYQRRAKDKIMSNQEEFDTETEAEQDIILTEPDLRQLSPLDWARYGTNRIAYLRPVMVNNQRSVAIHAADGTQIGAAPDYALGAAAIFQHGMGVALVH